MKKKKLTADRRPKASTKKRTPKTETKSIRTPLVHRLKTWAESLASVWSGQKTHEIRTDDRDFQVGDTLILEEYDPRLEIHMQRTIVCFVTCVTRGPLVPPGICVMSISPQLGFDGSTRILFAANEFRTVPKAVAETAKFRNAAREALRLLCLGEKYDAETTLRKALSP